MNKVLFFIILMTSTLGINAEGICYTREDSLKVVKMLSEGQKQKKGTNLMLYYGMRLQDVPYVASTLEVNKTEQLVVNMRQMDCTTFTETVLALALTTKQRSVRWEDYCKNLTTIRYRNGKMDGYTSRNHYFLWWMDSNKKLGIIDTPAIPSAVRKNQTININYMSTHSSAYKMLKGQKKDIERIAKMEQESKGRVVQYIPAAKVGLSQKTLGIKDGDILAIATKKQGLDTSHIGIASWGKDGKLHLLNASQIHKKVVLEPMTLAQYMKKHPTQLGIWVLRVNDVVVAR